MRGKGLRDAGLKAPEPRAWEFESEHLVQNGGLRAQGHREQGPSLRVGGLHIEGSGHTRVEGLSVSGFRKSGLPDSSIWYRAEGSWVQGAGFRAKWHRDRGVRATYFRAQGCRAQGCKVQGSGVQDAGLRLPSCRDQGFRGTKKVRVWGPGSINAGSREQGFQAQG